MMFDYVAYLILVALVAWFLASAIRISPLTGCETAATDIDDSGPLLARSP